ncbi:hypothetical protein CHS0354_003295 [Potamilus streckersoni]|uniref:Uncharacterized protein n=1 Tax=Potamilus streckersoni TaxID=2493646 RepID=A0AAE0S6C4_9BIVA|nr:hypothetical protein CHS0354_003295 [Potamilus streckersoni]
MANGSQDTNLSILFHYTVTIRCCNFEVKEFQSALPCNSKPQINNFISITAKSEGDEFISTVSTKRLRYAMNKITSAYAHAKAYSTWQDRAYSMANELEYFAEASQSFFAAENLSYSTGGMNTCGLSLCRTEAEERQHIRERDPELYAILSEVYTNNRPSLPGNLGVCTNIHA